MNSAATSSGWREKKSFLKLNKIETFRRIYERNFSWVAQLKIKSFSPGKVSTSAKSFSLALRKTRLSWNFNDSNSPIMFSIPKANLVRMWLGIWRTPSSTSHSSCGKMASPWIICHIPTSAGSIWTRVSCAWRATRISRRRTIRP